MPPWLGLALLLMLALGAFMLWGGFAIAWDATHPPRKGLAWALATKRPASPDDLQLESTETSLPGLDGVPCPAWHVRGAGGPDAPVLLMVHGWGRSRWDSLARISPLLPCIREAWLPDLPAHGEHTGTRSWVGVREPEAVAAMLGEIAVQCPGCPVLVCGHSLGAGVALRGAARAAKGGVPVVGVIMLSPYRDLHSPLPGRLALRDLPTQPFTALAVWMLRRVGCMDAPLDRDAAAIALPTFIATCEDDAISPVVDATMIEEAMPNATLLVLPGDRHDDPGAADPQRFADSMQAFVRGLSSSSRA
jgi:pimeloyl-ACP methyl ester carboxylesterase